MKVVVRFFDGKINFYTSLFNIYLQQKKTFALETLHKSSSSQLVHRLFTNLNTNSKTLDSARSFLRVFNGTMIAKCCAFNNELFVVLVDIYVYRAC